MIDYSKLAFPKPTPKVKKNKPINKISKKKQERLNSYSEKDLFLEVWNDREHKCEKCGRILKEAKAHNFDHIIPKSRGEKFRLDKENILLICFACHFEKTTGLKYKGINLD